LLPPGKSLKFVVEREKMDKLRKVISHNDGEIVAEALIDNGVRFEVRRTQSKKEGVGS